MLKYYSSYFLVLSCLTHLICCGLPVLLSLNTLLANVFFLGSISSYFEFFEKIENYVFSLVSALLFFIILLEVLNRNVKCSDYDNCSDEQCSTEKKKIRFNIIFSAVLYTINSYLFFSEKFI